jgi:hypothetical protein
MAVLLCVCNTPVRLVGGEVIFCLTLGFGTGVDVLRPKRSDNFNPKSFNKNIQNDTATSEILNDNKDVNHRPSANPVVSGRSIVKEEPSANPVVSGRNIVQSQLI